MKLLLLLLLPLITQASRAADSYFPPPDSAGGWREAKTAAEVRDLAGMDLAKLEPAYEVTQRSTAHGGLVVVHGGYLCFERYFGGAGRNVNPDMASTGKAFSSIACGIMLLEFKDKIPEGLDTKVFTQTYLPEAFPLNDPRKAEIKLGQLLCMTAGYCGEGGAPSGYVKGQPPQSFKSVVGQNIRHLDQSSLNVPLWCAPGAGYSYSSPAPHIASMVLRRVTGIDLKDYLQERPAKPQGWGAWDYCLHRGDFVMPHANGAGSTAIHATDVMRFGYCLARGGQWQDQQLVPADYIKLCHTWSPYNDHTPFSLQWEHNADGSCRRGPASTRMTGNPSLATPSTKAPSSGPRSGACLKWSALPCGWTDGIRWLTAAHNISPGPVKRPFSLFRRKGLGNVFVFPGGGFELSS